MKKNDVIFLEDIIEAVKKIEKFCREGKENEGKENGDAPQSNTSFAIRTIFVFFVVFCPPHR